MPTTYEIAPEEILLEAETLSNSEPAKADTQTVLKWLLNQVQKIDFKNEIPEYVKSAKRMDELNRLTINPDGSVKKGEHDLHSDELKRLSTFLGSFKIKQKHYLVIVIEKLIQLAKANQFDLRFYNGQYFVYNGQYWAIVDENELKSFLGTVSEKMGVSRFDSRHYEFKDKLFKQFESTGYASAPEKNPDLMLVNLKNGTLELSRNKINLREFRSTDFLTYQLNFAYDPEATAPKFEKYINRVLPDVQSQMVLAEYLGYVFTRNLKLEKVLILFGSGRNGKSVMFDIIQTLVGSDNISQYSLGKLTSDNGNHRAKIGNVLINWSPEIGDRLDPNVFKQLASGEPVEAKLLYKDVFILRDYCKFIFNTNTLPTDVEHTKAFFSRFLIIPFNQIIPENEQDPDLAKSIVKDELPGVFNWILEGLTRLIENRKFSKCEASNEVLKKFQIESDSVAMFVEDYGYKPCINSIPALPMYEDYKSYCISEGMRLVARKNFHNRLQSLGFTFGIHNIGKVIFATK